MHINNAHIIVVADDKDVAIRIAMDKYNKRFNAHMDETDGHICDKAINLIDAHMDIFICAYRT